MSSRLIKTAVIVVPFLIGACSKSDSDENKRDLTQREKDSILGASSVPGAKAVKKTLTTADSAAARQARLDSLEKIP